MDNTNITAYIWKADKRTKSGERLVSTTVWTGRDVLTVFRELEGVWPRPQYRFECVPTIKT